MKIIKKRVKVELTPSEKEVIEKMVKFTRDYFEATDKCVNLRCTDCPLSAFCGGTDLTRTVADAISAIEDHANNEE